jgi:hypothetical protein
MLFRGEYRFLSNFYPVEIEYLGLSYPSVENAFQAMKCKNPALRADFVNLTPSEAKKRGREVELRPDWDKIKLSVMESLLRIKFADPELEKKLLDIDGVIREDNYWKDTYWGWDINSNRGENNLGKLLMSIRYSARLIILQQEIKEYQENK